MHACDCDCALNFMLVSKKKIRLRFSYLLFWNKQVLWMTPFSTNIKKLIFTSVNTFFRNFPHSNISFMFLSYNFSFYYSAIPISPPPPNNKKIRRNIWFFLLYHLIIIKSPLLVSKLESFVSSVKNGQSESEQFSFFVVVFGKVEYSILFVVRELM